MSGSAQALMAWCGYSHDQIGSTEGVDQFISNLIPSYIPKAQEEGEHAAAVRDVEEFLHRWLIVGESYSSYSALDFILRNKLTLLFKASRVFLDSFALALQRRLDHIWTYLSQHPDQDCHTEADIKISALLAYLAFAKMKTGDKVFVPHYGSAGWERVEYQVERLNLTGSALGSPYYAYGLVPQNLPEAPAHILFMGTTHPGGNGFLWTLIFDLFGSVGFLGCVMGRKKIDAFIKQREGRAVFCHGQSLGGTMSVRTAARHLDKQVYCRAHVPAGTSYSPLTLNPESKVFIGGRDPVCLLGKLPSKASYYYSTPGESNPGRSAKVYSHATSFSFHQGTQTTLVDRSFFNQGRRLERAMLNRVLYVIGVLLVAPVLILVVKTVDIVINALMVITGLKWAMSNDRRPCLQAERRPFLESHAGNTSSGSGLSYGTSDL